MRHIRRILTTLVFVAFAVGVTTPSWAQTADEKERKELAAALGSAKVSLAQGLAAAAKHGKPISAKFEVEDGKLQLSVYVAKGKTFSEVIVDHVTGKVAKSQAITGGDDLKHGAEQAGAMSSAKVSLQEATSRAVKANAGYTAASVVPVIKDGRPTADVALMKGEERRVATESLQ
jgi:hypothetical protein